jgi:hypothetical protein
MTINEAIGEAPELKEFIFAARDCLDDLEYKPDVRLKKSVDALNNCPGPMLLRYDSILRHMAEKRPDSLMMRIYSLYNQTFKERIIPF